MEDQAKRRSILPANALPTHPNSYRLFEKMERWMVTTRPGDRGA